MVVQRFRMTSQPTQAAALSELHERFKSNPEVVALWNRSGVTLPDDFQDIILKLERAVTTQKVKLKGIRGKACRQWILKATIKQV